MKLDNMVHVLTDIKNRGVKDILIASVDELTGFKDAINFIKSLYLATIDIQEKWTQKIRNWSQILAHLSIYFGGEVDIYSDVNFLQECS